MYKKIITICATTAMMLHSVASAEVYIQVKNSVDNIITVSGTAKEGDRVYVTALNPGYTPEDVGLGSPNAIQYYGNAPVEDGIFSIDITLNGNLGGNGEFTFVISDSDNSETVKYSYYFSEYKESLIKELESVTIAELKTQVDYLYGIFGLSGEKLFTDTDKYEIARLICVLRDNNMLSDDVDTFYGQLKEVLYVAAFNCENEKLFVENKLKLDNTDLFKNSYADYLTSLSEKGIYEVNESVIGKGFDDYIHLTTAFEEAVALNLVVNNNILGYGHVGDVIKKYSNVFDAVGIKASDINNSFKKNEIYSALKSSGASNLEELKDAYDNIILYDGGKGGNGGGNVGSSGGGSAIKTPVGTIGGTISGISPENDTENPPKSDAVSSDGNTVFNDMKGYEWANEAVDALYALGVVNGRYENKFSPSETVTRAEFAKMLYVAFFGEPEAAESLFDDVEGWSEPYVAACNAKGVINGLSEKIFAPDVNISREQAAVMLKRAFDLSDTAFLYDGDIFEDDSEISLWAKDAVYSLKSAGIVLGKGNNRYHPTDSLTRAEAAKIIYSSIKITGGVAK